MLSSFYDKENFDLEIGVDESGRGPLFGRLYVSAVVFPKENEAFRENPLYISIKDSKKFVGKKAKQKIREVATFIKESALAYSIQYVEHDVIDRINIREAVLMAMKQCIDEILSKVCSTDTSILLLIDGNDFRPYMKIETDCEWREIPHICIEQGDGKYISIASASILAKVARDDYILDICEKNPELVERYQLNTNMGYGTKAHMDGIRQYGISHWHRRSYGICKQTK
jgi:ribonuclease HII